MNELQKKIVALKEEKNAIILAHYYTRDEVQELADFVGDSYYLAKIASSLEAETIVLCGVSFMGESVKVLNPEKTIIIPEPEAHCPMAYMVTSKEIERMRARHDDLAVVCYINSTAEIKAHSDVCVTSANALEIVKNLPQRTIFFVPDENLGSYIAQKVPEKKFIFNGGYCHVHTAITEELVHRAKGQHPDATVLAHPECKPDVLSLADYVGSTSGIIEYATRSEGSEFIVCTEMGILYELEKKNPGKVFHLVQGGQVCPEMKKITLEKICAVLEDGGNNVFVKSDTAEKAILSLKRMLELVK